MNGATIDSILSKCLGKVFKGVYSFDQWRLLPITRPAAYVFNTMPQHENFGHWIGIYIYNSGKAVFFDTFGRAAEQLGFHMFFRKTLFHVHLQFKSSSELDDFDLRAACYLISNACKTTFKMDQIDEK